MNYYVVGPDGNRFGPADLTMLNAWAREGRVVPASKLEEVGTGRSFLAHELFGLEFPATVQQAQQIPQYPPNQPGYPGNPGYSGYYRAQQGYSGYPQSSSNLTTAWVLGTVAIVLDIVSCACCCLAFPVSLACSIIGVVLASKARSQNQPGAQSAWIFNIVAIVLSGLAIIAYIVFMGFAFSGMGRPTGRSPFDII